MNTKTSKIIIPGMMNLRMKVNLLNALIHQECLISDDDDDLFVNKSTDKSVDQKPKKPTVPFKLASIPSSKHLVSAILSSKPLVSAKTMGSSIVDQILLEESRRANQPISGSVILLRQQQKIEGWKLTIKINSIFPSSKKLIKPSDE